MMSRSERRNLPGLNVISEIISEGLLLTVVEEETRFSNVEGTETDGTLTDEGEYTVMAGTDKSTAELIISEAPTDFTAQLKDQTVTEFEDAEFVATLTKEKADVKWYRNRREIREGPRYANRYTFERDGKNCILRVKKCRPDDECEYACGVDEKRSRARLYVDEVPVEIIRRPQDVFKPPGSDIVFEVELNKDGVEVKWLRNNMTVVQGEKYQMMTEGKVHRLQVCEIRPSDQREYRLVVKDKDAKAKLELAAVPQIKTTDQDYVTDAGKPIVMAVPYSAYPQEEAYWVFDQQSLSKDHIYTSADKTELRMKDPKKADEGRYEILIKNKHGTGEAFINLQVIDVPGPVKNLQVIDTADGEVSLAWEEPESDGGAKVEGYVVETWDPKRRLATDKADGPEYTVTGLQKDSYYFRVCARNRIGSGPNVCTKAVQAKNKFDVPEAPRNVLVENVSKFGCTVSFDKPVSDGGSPITAYIIERRDCTAQWWTVAVVDELSAIVNDVIENKEYIFRVKVENKAGVGKPSAASNPVKIMDPIGNDGKTVLVDMGKQKPLDAEGALKKQQALDAAGALKEELGVKWTAMWLFLTMLISFASGDMWLARHGGKTFADVMLIICGVLFGLFLLILVDLTIFTFRNDQLLAWVKK